jgi:hypothetical protein
MLAYMADRGGQVTSIGGGFATLEGNNAKIPLSQLVKTGITPPAPVVKPIDTPPEFVNSSGGRFTVGCRVQVTFDHLDDYDRKAELKEKSRPLGAYGKVLAFEKGLFPKSGYSQAQLLMDDGSALTLPLGYLNVIITKEPEAKF